MASFDLYLPQLLRFEGGFVDDPDDPGGATNYGITLATFQRCAQALLGEAPTLQALRALTVEQAATIYQHEYWDRIGADQIASQPLAELVFDFYVNAGDVAIKLLQRILQQLGATDLVIDGEMGPTTLAALASADTAQVYAQYRQQRIDYYQRVVAERPVDAKFLAGWLRRAEWFPANLPADGAAPAQTGTA
ncbi:N-acetylmuramidase [Xanthomonas sp. 3307]|uniref:glycoside hydrolase family 108 protein n=1 Tax=Xanthomonas sp. 3307 TaxID=3035316 RepID=UPI00161501E2|nr:N-acetylmuramidase [Xanthomonas sp. 3307]MBB5941039.1 type VI secretion system secreted protein VgrG [Xanthomonas sp. 3307]